MRAQSTHNPRRSAMPARKVHARQIKRPSVDLLGAIGGEMEAEASRSQRSTSTSTQPLGLRCQRREAISAYTETRAQSTPAGTTFRKKLTGPTVSTHL